MAAATSASPGDGSASPSWAKRIIRRSVVTDKARKPPALNTHSSNEKSRSKSLSGSASPRAWIRSRKKPILNVGDTPDSPDMRRSVARFSSVPGNASPPGNYSLSPSTQVREWLVFATSNFLDFVANLIINKLQVALRAGQEADP